MVSSRCSLENIWTVKRMNIRQLRVEHHHAGFHAPEGEKSTVFGNEDPFAPLNPRRLSLWSQSRDILSRHEIRASNIDDLVQGDAKQSVPHQTVDHNVIVEFELETILGVPSNSVVNISTRIQRENSIKP